MQRDEFKIYEPLKPVPQPKKTIEQEYQELKNIDPNFQIQELEGANEKTTYVLSDKEREVFNQKLQSVDANDTFKLTLSHSLKHRLKAAADSQCTTLNHLLNVVLNNWVNEFEKSESRRRGD